MKKINYMVEKIDAQIKNKKESNKGYEEIFSILYKDFFNYNSEEDWVNKDYIFTDNEIVFNALNKFLGYKDVKSYNLPLSALYGIAKGRKKLIETIKNDNKKVDIINYSSYMVIDYEKLKSGEFLETAIAMKDKKVSNIVVVALKHSSEKTNDIVDFYEENEFLVFESNISKLKSIHQNIKIANKSKTASIIIVEVPEDYKSSDNDIEVFDIKSSIKERNTEVYKKWLSEYDKVVESKNQNILDIINYLKTKKLNIDLEAIEFKLDPNYENSIDKSSEKIFSILEEKSDFIKNVTTSNDSLALGISMGLSVIGFKPTCEVKDITKVYGLINKCNKYNLPVNLTIKDITAPIDIMGLNVYYPCDMHEVIGTWSSIIKQNKTSLIVLSEKEAKLMKNTNIKYVKYGAYMIRKENEVLNGVISASGEEINLALAVAGLLEKENLQFRVVTMPCPNLLLNQVKYEKDLLPRSVKNFVIDNSDALISYKFSSNKDCVIPAKLGLDRIKEKIKDLLID